MFEVQVVKVLEQIANRRKVVGLWLLAVGAHLLESVIILSG
jgi:hypothetical protein